MFTTSGKKSFGPFAEPCCYKQVHGIAVRGPNLSDRFPTPGEVSFYPQTGMHPVYYVRPSARWNTMQDEEQLHTQLTELKNEHRELDELIEELSDRGPSDQIRIQRLKKRKLMLKDQISILEDALLPDIIA